MGLIIFDGIGADAMQQREGGVPFAQPADGGLDFFEGGGAGGNDQGLFDLSGPLEKRAVDQIWGSDLDGGEPQGIDHLDIGGGKGRCDRDHFQLADALDDAADVFSGQLIFFQKIEWGFGGCAGLLIIGESGRCVQQRVGFKRTGVSPHPRRLPLPRPRAPARDARSHRDSRRSRR